MRLSLENLEIYLDVKHQREKKLPDFIITRKNAHCFILLKLQKLSLINVIFVFHFVVNILLIIKLTFFLAITPLCIPRTPQPPLPLSLTFSPYSPFFSIFISQKFNAIRNKSFLYVTFMRKKASFHYISCHVINLLSQSILY